MATVYLESSDVVRHKGRRCAADHDIPCCEDESDLKTKVPTKLPCEFVERIIYLAAESGTMLPQLGAVVEFGGRIDEERLARAVELMLVAEPVLGCRFVAGSKPPHWRRLDRVRAADLVEVRESANVASDAAVCIAAKFDPCAGAQIRATILRGPQGDALAVSVSHVAMDGGALKQLLYQLGEVYRTLSVDPGWRPSPNASPRNPGAVAHSANLRQKFEALKPESVEDLLPPTDWGIPSLGSRGWPAYVSRTVEREAFQRAIEFGRERRATVNDLLLAAYYRTLFRILVPPLAARTPVQMSCELRKHLPAGTKTGLCNISSSWAASIAPAGGERFEHTLARVTEQTQEWKRNGWGVKSALGLVLAGRVFAGQGLGGMRKQQVKATSRMMANGEGYPVLTNIGVIDDAHLDFGPDAPVSDAYLYGPVGYPGGFILTATTFRGAMTLSAGVDLMAVDADLAGSIVEGTAAELREVGLASS